MALWSIIILLQWSWTANQTGLSHLIQHTDSCVKSPTLWTHCKKKADRHSVMAQYWLTDHLLKILILLTGCSHLNSVILLAVRLRKQEKLKHVCLSCIVWDRKCPVNLKRLQHSVCSEGLFLEAGSQMIVLHPLDSNRYHQRFKNHLDKIKLLMPRLLIDCLQDWLSSTELIGAPLLSSHILDLTLCVR